jgi:endonuclease G
MNKKSIVIVLSCLIITTILFSCRKYENNVENKDNAVSDLVSTTTVSGMNFLPTSTSGQIIKHNNYTLSYVEYHEQAEWVAYELKKSDLNYNNNDFKRPYFIEDPKVKTGSADWKNYRRSGYDRGHLCPAGDRKFSRTAFNETFYTSNISPQLNDFNEGIWNKLEQKTRYWASKYNGLYVVTGGVLSKNLETIGYEDVSIPDYFYKILVDKENGKYKMIGFLLPHEDSNKPLYEFVVPVDKIEQMTGINFFPAIEDNIENKLEKSSDYKEWSFR